MSRYRQVARRMMGVSRRYAGPSMSYAAGAIARRAAFRFGKSFTRTMTTNNDNGGPITAQRDFKTDYRKRRVSRRGRRVMRRRRKWTRRVLRTVREATIGSQHIVRRTFIPSSTTLAGTSSAIAFGMNSLNGYVGNASYPSNNDFGQIMYEAVGNTTWANWENSALVSHDLKIHNMHSTMEMTINNVGEKDAIVEVYYIRSRKRVETSWSDPANIYRAGFRKQDAAQNPDTDDGVPNTIGAELADSDLGVTPFQCALFCRTFTIYKRQKYIIPAGDEVSFTMTDSRPQVYTLGNTKPYCLDKRYRGVLMQFFGKPSLVPDTPADSVTLAFQSTRRYRIKIDQQGQTRDGQN